ncbi:hypothetical protein BI364_16435 [Acidihalobacter yilgarnensis]|uniref:Uncharacterized protein n=1 Tax=Acidihalobacter yilgarnensis TaxID=2819280 RepID=A0A1D8ISD1_9GAMM|nr:hypothetical protein [Acidihalobacter yilgarnensis]AOU99305.1 hypothetical protein BI364_16435 [Acidihalobacter yilgarnensis]
MDAKTTHHNNIAAGVERTTVEADAGPLPTIIIIILAVGAIGYMANIIELGAQSHVPAWLRAMGAYLPPLGALLGLM